MQLTDALLLMGGLALFLYGMHIMGEGLEVAAGSKLKGLLEKLTKNRFLGMLVGLVITAVIQSSSATTVMVVGFVNAGLMNLAQAIGVIMGANIGTTATGLLIALDIGMLAPALALIGVGLVLFSKKQKIKAIGQVIAGLGILFIGMGNMSDAMKPLREVPAFQQMMTSFSNPIIGIAVGALFTAVIQSSSAAIGILQALAFQGLIGLDSAVFVLFGMNIGTCITSILSSIGTNRNARRTALVHLLFNIIGTAIFVALSTLLPFTDWVKALARDNPKAQIALAHTIFNVVTTLLLLPAGTLLAKIATKLIPGEDRVPEQPKLQFIDDRIFGASSMGILQLTQEVDRMERLARENLQSAMESFVNKDDKRLAIIAENEEVLDYLNKEITKYLVKINAMELDLKEAKMVSALFHVTSDLERIGDHAQNIADYTRGRLEGNVHFSQDAIAELTDLSTKVFQIVDDAYVLFHDKGEAHLEQIEAQEAVIDALTEQYQAHHIERLRANRCTPETGLIFVEILTDLERVADHATNIAEALSK